MEWSCRVVLIIFLHLSASCINFLAADPVPNPLSSDNTISSYIQSRLSARTKRSTVIFSASKPPLPPPVVVDRINPAANAEHSDSTGLISVETVLSCNHISNGLVQQYRDTLYLLSANQLFLVNVQADKKFLSPVATFEPFTENATQFSVHPWTAAAAEERELVVAIAFQTHYNVYRFAEPPPAASDDGASFNRKQIVRQKIAIVGGRSIKVLLFTDSDELYLLLADNTAHGRSSISIYEYRHDYFRETNVATGSTVDKIDVDFFEEGPLIMAVQYCREHCQQTAIQIYDMRLKKLQKMFTMATFVKLIKHNLEPRLVTCKETDCMVYFFQERHFLNPFPFPLHFRVAEVVTKRRRVVMRSTDNILYLYTRKEVEHSATLRLTGLYGRIRLHSLYTPFNQIYAVISSVNETSVTFSFYHIKNDTELLLGQAERGAHGDPFDEIEACANRLKSQFDKSFAMTTKINAILAKIIRLDGEAHFDRILVNNSLEVTEFVAVKDIDLITDAQFSGQSVLDELEVMRNRTREIAKQTESFIVGDPLDGSDPIQSGPLLTAKTIKVKNLRTRSKKFNNLITKSGRNSVQGHLTVNKLITSGIQIESGVVNQIPLNSLYSRRTNSTVPGTTSLTQMTTDNLHIRNSFNGIDIHRLEDLDKNQGNPKELQLQNIRTKNLTVNFINGVDVHKFLRDCYLPANTADKIQGNLIFTEPLTIRGSLQATKLNSVPVSHYLTLATDQEIERKVIFKNFFAYHVNADRINGIQFGKVAVVQGEKNTIETPVRIENMVINHKLTLSEQENRQMAQHIVGTKVEDLSQSYTGKVVIKGNLVLHNLTLEMAQNLFLNEVPFPLNALAGYWTRNTHQTFDAITINGRVETSQLFAESLNNHPARSFVTTGQEIIQTDSNLHFADVVIDRNIRTNGVSRILELSRKAVRRGETAVIEGLKHFENITTNHLITSFVNNQQMSNLFLNLTTILSCDHKIYFDELYLHTDLDSPANNNLRIDAIDGVNVQSLFADTVYINQPTELVSIEIDQFEADGDLYVENLNGVNTRDALERLDGLQFMVNVTGRANVERILVDRVNGIDVRDYFQLLVRTDRAGPQELGGTKKFLQGLRVQSNLQVQRLSGMDVPRWMQNAVRWDENHDITEEWVFRGVQVESLFAQAINGVPTDLLIDARSNIILDQDLHVNQMAVQNGKIVAVGAHNWTRIVHNLQNPLPRDWDRVTVTGDVLMPEGPSKLWELITYGVNNRHPQSFTREINFLGTTRIRKLIPGRSRINGIDLEAVITDTLRDDIPDGQIVRGAIVFENGIDVAHLRASQLDVVYINDINLSHLNQSLWRPNTHPMAFPQLQFPQRITIDQLRVNGSINGVSSDQLGTIDEVDIQNVELFGDILVRGNVTIGNINNVSLDYILKEHGRLTAQKRQRFTGVLSFEELIIRGASTINSINGIQINSLLLSKSDKMQEVSGLKAFNNIYFKGPANINRLNNVRLIDMYKNTINRHLTQKLDRLNVKQMVAGKGLEIRESLNDIPIDYFQTDQLSLPDIRQMETQLKAIIATDFSTRKREKRFNYFDYAHNFEVISGGNDSSHITLKRYAQGDCRSPAQPRCLCKRQVEIQMSKLDEIHIHRSSSNISSQLAIGENEISISNANACDPSKALGYLWLTRRGERFTVSLNGTSNLIGSIIMEDNSKLFFLTETQFKKNYTITIWQVQENGPVILKIRSLVYEKTQSASAHLMAHNSTNLLIVSVTFNPPKHNFLWVYRFFPHAEEGRFKMQHVLRINYDLFASLTTASDESYLVGAQSGTKWMDIYKVYYSTPNDTYQLSGRTRIPFDYPLKDVISFAVQDQLFVAALLDNGHLFIYRYNYAQGWLQESFGNFQQIEHVDKLSIIQNPVDLAEYLVVSGANSTAALISIH